MAYFGANLQNANNIGKTTEILATWELVNELENHFINAKKKRDKKKKQQQNARNDTILKRRENCHFSIL